MKNYNNGSQKSVRMRYAVLVFIAIVLSVAVVGAFGINTLWKKTNRDVVSIMNLTTEAKASELDFVLLKIRDAVDTVSAYVGARVATSEMQLDEVVITGGMEDEIQELFLSAVENLDGCVGYYIRFAKPYNTLISGFAFQKNKNDAPFHSVPENRIFSEEEEWFRLAESAEVPVWIPIRECNYNSDCNYILSYAVPVFFNSTLVGVVCVDMDFEILAEPVRELRLFDNGYSYLTDDKGKVYYHPLIGYGVLLTEDEDDVPEVDSALADTSNHGELIVYDYKGQTKEMAFKSLINDMRLVVTANKSDIEKEPKLLVRNTVLSGIGIIIVIMLLAMLMERRTMHPVLDKMDSLAHLDGLTGLQNKTSFLEILAHLNTKIQEGTAVFGFVMLDANNLKRINDQYGHKMGDVYLLGVVEIIQNSFPGCQSYRIGGDEFVVLLDGEEGLRNADSCLKSVINWQKKRREEKRDPWETPSVAYAYAAYNPATHKCAEDVLSEADTLMYQNKQKMKSESE